MSADCRPPLSEDHRPWGFYRVLADEPDHKVKRITVYPGRRLSYQRHFRRSEHWYLLSGRAVVTRDGQDLSLSAGEAVDLPVTTWHRIRNPGDVDLVFIEVQTGDYFGEDDIERTEVDSGRACAGGTFGLTAAPPGYNYCRWKRWLERSIAG